jgi:predicted dehydrogenase
MRAGLVGCGRVSGDHCRGLRAAAGVELVALADVHEESLNAVGEAFGVERRYRDYREMLARERLDLLTVSTQAPQHAPITIDAVEAGVRGVIVEKPIAMTLAEADAMVAACDRAGARLAVNHQTRMVPQTFAAEELLRQGAIGDFRVARMMDKGGRPAGNSLMELITHIFDFLRIYAGDPAWGSAHLTVGDGESRRQRLATIDDIQRSQEAWPSDRDCGLVLGDRCSATYGFGPREGWHDGLTATMESFFQLRTAASIDRWHPNLELIGTEGILFLGGTSDHVDLYLHRGPWKPPGRMERITAPRRPVAPGPYQDEGLQAPHHTAMVEELVAAVGEGREHRSSGRDGRWALEMIMAAYESHRRGGSRVALPLEERGHPLERWLEEAGGSPGG